MCALGDLADKWPECPNGPLHVMCIHVDVHAHTQKHGSFFNPFPTQVFSVFFFMLAGDLLK